MAQRLGLELEPEQLRWFERYTGELLEWNTRVNLTSITDPAEVELRHYVDSLSVVLGLPGGVEFRGSVVDVGSGGGFPGVPLALALPGLRLALVESVGRKARFLEHLVEVLGLTEATVCVTRAEELARRPEAREHFDVAVTRAVGSLAVLCELCLPLCRVGGRMIAQKRGDCREEIEEAERALATLGGGTARVVEAPLEQLRGAVLVVVEKVSPTPERYPRRAGMPAKRPL